MNHPLKIIDLNYFCHEEFTTPQQVIVKHQSSNLVTRELKKYANIVLVKHLNYTGAHAGEGLQYRFFNRKNSFWQIPFRTHRFIKKEKPDIVLVHGFIFPLQVMALRMKLGRQCKIILQHQAEPPFRKKKIFQRINDRFVDAYLFTSTEMNKEWLKAGVISDPGKCYELPCASTLFTQQDKEKCRQQTRMGGETNFLWVGRLNDNKDPLTVLRGLEKYFSVNPAAKLYMIYQEDDLLADARRMVEASSWLKERVIMVGRIDYTELETWYSAADYLVSGSHREGGSYALMEAMSCGCVPIVTNIPASMKTIDYGKAGYYYEPGNPDQLFKILSQLDKNKQATMSAYALTQFKEQLSAAAIANKFLRIYEKLRAGMV